jgi:hypothetical protein
MKKFLVAVAAIVCLMTGALFVKAQNSGISGKWHFVLDTPGGDRDVDAEFTVDAEGKVTGTFGKTAAAGIFKDGNLDMTFDMTAEETGETAQMKLVGKLDAPSTLTGKWQFSSYDGSFKAARPKN